MCKVWMAIPPFSPPLHAQQASGPLGSGHLSPSHLARFGNQVMADIERMERGMVYGGESLEWLV